MTDPKLVSDNDTVTCGLPYHPLAEESHIDTTTPREQVTSTVTRLHLLAILYQKGNRKSWPSGGSYGHHVSLVERHNNILLWRGTQTVEKLAKGVLIPPLDKDVKNVLGFLHSMYKRGCRYSEVCAVRRTLSSAVTIPGYERKSNHPHISIYKWYL